MHVELNHEGELIGLPGGAQAALRGPVCLHLPPGSCLLRVLNVAGMNRKEIAPALALLAEASLPLPPDQYYTDSWQIGPELHALAALPSEPLDRARGRVAAAGGRLAAVRVPELCPPPVGPSAAGPRPARPHAALVLWSMPEPGGLLACLWRGQTLYRWQHFPQRLPRQALLEQLAANADPAPAAVYLNWMRSELDPWAELDAVWPQAEVIETWDWDLAERARRFGPGPQLQSFLRQEQRRTASRSDKLRLGLALGGAVCTALFLFFAEVAYLERQAEQLRHQVSLLKVKANRSEKVAARSGQTLRRIRELQALAVERRGVLEALKALTDALPARVRLERINVERGGATALDGLAETELDVSNLLENLSQAPLLTEPRLTFTQKEETRGDTSTPALIRFRLEARLAEPLLAPVGVPAAGAPAAAGSQEEV